MTCCKRVNWVCPSYCLKHYKGNVLSCYGLYCLCDNLLLLIVRIRYSVSLVIGYVHIFVPASIVIEWNRNYVFLCLLISNYVYQSQLCQCLKMIITYHIASKKTDES